MKNKCPIVLDLLPLAADKLLREETGAFVAEHIAVCEDCRRAYEEIISAPSPAPESAPAPLHALHKKLIRARIFTALCAAFIAAAAAFALYIAAAQPHYYPYSDDLFAMTEYTDGSVELTFGPDVTYNSATHCYWEEKGRTIMVYEIQAGYTILDRLRPSGVYSSTIRLAPDKEMPMVIYYTQNNGRENVCIYGREHISGGVQTLARLTLGYYFIIAGTLAIILTVLTAIIKKARPVMEKNSHFANLLFYGANHIWNKKTSQSFCFETGVNTSAVPLKLRQLPPLYGFRQTLCIYAASRKPLLSKDFRSSTRK